MCQAGCCRRRALSGGIRQAIAHAGKAHRGDGNRCDGRPRRRRRCGLVLAILMVQSRLLRAILMPLLVIDQSVPKMALAPIFVIWFGTGMMTRVVIAMVISFFPVVINAIRGMTTVDRRVNDLMTTISASRWNIMTKVQLPNAVPYIFSGSEGRRAAFDHRCRRGRIHAIGFRAGLHRACCRWQRRTRRWFLSQYC